MQFKNILILMIFSYNCTFFTMLRRSQATSKISPSIAQRFIPFKATYEKFGITTPPATPQLTTPAQQFSFLPAKWKQFLPPRWSQAKVNTSNIDNLQEKSAMKDDSLEKEYSDISKQIDQLNNNLPNLSIELILLLNELEMLHIDFKKNKTAKSFYLLKTLSLFIENMKNNPNLLTEEHVKFQQWLSMQPEDIQLNPFIKQYNNEWSRYKQDKEKDITNVKIIEMQSLLPAIMKNPDLSRYSADFIERHLIEKRLAKENNKFQEWLSKQPKHIQSNIFIKQYNNEWNRYKQNKTEAAINKIIKMQLMLPVIMKNLDLSHYFSEYLEEHYDNNINELNNIYQTESELKPELLALRQLETLTASSLPLVPLCSQKIPIDLAGEYNSHTKIISLGKEWNKAPPSSKLFTIYHEYRHYLQDKAGILKTRTLQVAEKFFPRSVKDAAKKAGISLEKYDENSWMPTEQDADHFAITHITCPTCLKVIQGIRSDDKYKSKGYYSTDDIESHIQLAELLGNTTCPAHTKTLGDDTHNEIVEKLEKYLSSQRYYITKENRILTTLTKLIIILDEQSGGLLKHIPNFNQTIINALRYYRKFRAKFVRDLKKIKEEKTKSKKQNDIKLLPEPKGTTLHSINLNPTEDIKKGS